MLRAMNFSISNVKSLGLNSNKEGGVTKLFSTAKLSKVGYFLKAIYI